MAQVSSDSVVLTSLGKQLLSDYIRGEFKVPFEGNFSAFYLHFAERVGKELSKIDPTLKVIAEWSIRRWEKKLVARLEATSVMQLAIYRGETFQSTCTWLSGGTPQGPFLDRFLPVLRTETLSRRELAEVITVAAYRLSIGDLIDDEDELGGSTVEEPLTIKLSFNHEWYPALVRAAQLFGSRHEVEPDGFHSEFGVRPGVITALLARQDLNLSEVELQRLIEALAKDEPGLTAPELLAILTGSPAGE